eukprot:jgi/Bigna1/67793/fgenesh1_pg.4_\
MAIPIGGLDIVDEAKLFVRKNNANVEVQCLPFAGQGKRGAAIFETNDERYIYRAPVLIPTSEGKQLESMLRLRIVQCPGNVKCSEDPASLSRRCTEIMFTVVDNAIYSSGLLLYFPFDPNDNRQNPQLYDFAGRKTGIKRVYTSAMYRALQTASPIHRRMKIPTEVWPSIHETGGVFHMNKGVLRGLTRDQILVEFSGYNVAEKSGVSTNGWWRGGVETYDQMIERAISSKKRLFYMAGQIEEDTTIAVISHGSFLSALIRSLTQANCSFALLNTSISCIDIQVSPVEEDDDDCVRVVLGDKSHAYVIVNSNVLKEGICSRNKGGAAAHHTTWVGGRTIRHLVIISMVKHQTKIRCKTAGAISSKYGPPEPRVHACCTKC